MNIKKIISVFFALVILLLLLPQTVFAEEAETDSAIDIGQNDIYNALPDYSKGILENGNITPDNGGVGGLAIGDVLKQLWQMLLDNIEKPVKLLLSMMGIILLCSLANSMGETAPGSGQGKTTFNIISVLVGSALLIGYISEAIARANEVIHGGNVFLLSFIPAFAGMIGASGQITTATVFNGLVLGGSQLFTQLAIHIIMPLSTCIMGLSLAGAVNPELKLDRICEGAKKLIVWGLGLLMTLFVGLLGLQSFVTNSSDTITLRAARFTVSNAVPFVGGSISDALSTMHGSVSLIKNSFGTFGIIAGASIVLPVIINVVLYKIAMTIANAVCDMFGLSQLSEVIKSGESVMSIILATLICFMLMAIISTSLMLFIGANGGF